MLSWTLIRQWKNNYGTYMNGLPVVWAVCLLRPYTEERSITDCRERDPFKKILSLAIETRMSLGWPLGLYKYKLVHQKCTRNQFNEVCFPLESAELNTLALKHYFSRVNYAPNRYDEHPQGQNR